VTLVPGPRTLAQLGGAPLHAFATDGPLAWLRHAGAQLVAVDAASGEVVREVRLAPAPFGVGWKVERHGTYFIVRDDRELAAYDDTSGVRLWKRSSTGHVAFVGERDGKHISVMPAAGGEGVDVALADLATGAFDAKLRVQGTMTYVGAHGTLAGDLLFLATDEREVVAIDVSRWEIAHRHRMTGSHALPPVATAGGVHVASIEHRDGGSVTHVSSFDRETGTFVSTFTMAGAGSALLPGTNGLVLEARRRPNAPVERIAFRPETPSVRLAVAKHVDMRLVRTDALRLDRAVSPAPRLGYGNAVAFVQSARVATATHADGRHDEMVPAPRDGSEGHSPTPRDGLLGLLALLDARSDVLTRLADAFEERSGAFARIQRLGITFRDPRARWSSGAGRDPSLVDLAENRDGDAIATYFYPRAENERVPVVLVSRATGEARWLADDFDVWFAGVLHNALAYAPEAVFGIMSDLQLSAEYPRALANASPPPWFFEAHATPWTHEDADAALAAGDVEGAERMLVSVGRSSGGNPALMFVVKERLASLYAMLGWDHHRATVVETW
jgi:hypothetical protein